MSEQNITDSTKDEYSDKDGKPIVVFVATSTNEKIFNLKRIAEAKGCPIIFEDSNKLLGAFNHVNEVNGNYKDNANDKLASIDIQGFRDAANYGDKLNGSKGDDAKRAAEGTLKVEYKARYKNVFKKEASDEEVKKYIDQVINYKKRITNYLKDRGLPEESTRMFFASEDGGFALPEDIWKQIAEKHSDGIPKDVLSKIKPDEKHQGFTGPGSETAPVFSAVLGEYNFMLRVQKAIAELGKNGQEIPVLQNSVMHLEEFTKDSSGERIVFSADKINNLYLPDKGLMEEIFTGNAKKISTYDYSKPTAEAKESIIERGEGGIINHGVRALLIDQIYDKIFGKKEDKSQPDYKRPYNYNHPHIELVNENHGYRVGAFAFGSQDTNVVKTMLGDIKLGEGYAISIPKSRPINEKTSSYDILNNIEHVVANNDAVLLFPDSSRHNAHSLASENPKLAEIMKIYTLSSLSVNKQLNARDVNKPIPILNHDGSWDNAIAIHNNLSNIGMTKDYGIYQTNEVANKNGINIESNSYFDVIGTPKDGVRHSYEKTVAAATELLKEKRKGYNPRTPSQSPREESGIPPKSERYKDVYKVAMFCSASSENEHLNEAVKDISYNLVKSGSGIVYGGGDRYTMGAVLDGVLQRRQELTNKYHVELINGNGHASLSQNEETRKVAEIKAKEATYIVGYSTRQILKSETTKAAFSPDLNYAKQNVNIYERMADMLDNSNVIVAAPGGAGTVQEWAAALILNHYRPKAEQKPIVFFNPVLNKDSTPTQVWNVALKAVLGKDDYELLTEQTTNKIKLEKRERRSKELGIYVKTTEEDILKCISELKEEHNKNKGDKKKLDFGKSNGYVPFVKERSAPSVLGIH